MDSGLKQIGEAIAAALPSAVSGFSTAFGELTLTVEAARLVETVTYLRDDPNCLFLCFIDLTAVDYPAREKRFDVVTHLLSPKAQSPHPHQGRDRRDDAGCLAHRPLSRRRLVRA